MEYILLGIITVINSILYRLGGARGWSKNYRRIGCALTTTVGFFLFLPPHWSFVVCILLLYGALTTYLSELVKPANDVCGTEWFLSGLLYGLAALPLIAVCSWYAVLIRAVMLAWLSYMWSINIDSAVLEETGRGALLTLTIPILTI